MIKVAPTGSTIRGHVLDVSLKPFVRALKSYDPYLYVIWNSRKLKGWGCYEIRRAPENNSVAEIYKLEGFTIHRLEPCELEIINHVLDCAFLNYDQIRKIKSMDVWGLGPTKELASQKFLNDIDAKDAQTAKDKAQKAIDARRYAYHHYKKELNHLKDEIQSGWDPNAIGSMWSDVKEAE